jgi:2-methylisocitrate lyase-like PEP mutase family enzyme
VTEREREKAEALRALHEAPELLVLPNVWDAASARTVAALPECRALATPSAGIAMMLGVEDDDMTLGPMIDALGVICAAVDLPVTADLQDGYADTAETVRAAIDVGAVGCNLEDKMGDADEHAERVRAARAAGEAAGVPVLINARTDVFIRPDPDVGEAIRRGRLYLDAGADCVFAIGVGDPEDMRALGKAFDGRLSVYAAPGFPPLSTLAELGVCRVTFGPGLMRAALDGLQRAARELLALGAPPDSLAGPR